MSPTQVLRISLISASLALAACANTGAPTDKNALAPVQATQLAPVETKATNDDAAQAKALEAQRALEAAKLKAEQDAAKAVSAANAIAKANEALMSKTVILFDYDQFGIQSGFADLVEKHGVYLSRSPNARVRLEGHTDERGSRDYNVALGQKRADAVAKALKVFGAQDNQIEAVSFGKEKPASAGANEQAWAQNRRVELNYTVK